MSAFLFSSFITGINIFIVLYQIFIDKVNITIPNLLGNESSLKRSN
ncbi:hypothetical protein BH23BAC1_BH23BAC1_00140 [soil metagenome]